MTISVQVFDCTLGRPAQGVFVRLERRVAAEWDTKVSGVTHDLGTLPAIAGYDADPGGHRLLIAPSSYFAALGAMSLYREFAVEFQVNEAQLELHLTAHISVAACATYWRRQ
jgi:5-hydroxyisourate hydrolase